MVSKTLAQARAEQARAMKDAARPAPSAQHQAQSHTHSLLMLKLQEDKRTLKAIESIARKIEKKRELLPYYVEWVNAVLQKGIGLPDPVLMTVMLWRIDVADFAGALAIAEYALVFHLDMPDQYQRKPPSIIVEEIADTALSLLKHSENLDKASILPHLKYTHELTATCDMADEVRAKIHKLIGLYAEDSDPTTALQHLTEAYRLNEKCGVKANINRLEKLVKTES